MNKLLLSLAVCGAIMASTAYAAPMPASSLGMSATNDGAIVQVMSKKKMMMMKKKKMMMKKKMM